MNPTLLIENKVYKAKAIGFKKPFAIVIVDEPYDRKHPQLSHIAIEYSWEAVYRSAMSGKPLQV